MNLRSCIRFLTRGLVVRPFRRAAALRRDDDGQVMLITGVFVFIVAVATITSLNTSELLFNRVRTQNAADAAADAFALWQARAFNVNQHLNDYHIEKNIEFMGRTLLSCTKRFVNLGMFGVSGPSACQQQWRPATCACFARVNQDGNVNGVRNCCRGINDELAQIEAEQAMVSNLVLLMQGIIDFVGPKMGWLAANEVAKGSGADRISSNNDLISKIEQTLLELGVTYDLNDTLSASQALGLVPPGDVHVVPLRPPVLEMLPLPTGAMGNPVTMIPPWFFTGRCLFGPLNDISCMISTCGERGQLWCAFIWPLVQGFIQGPLRDLFGPSAGCTACFFAFNPLFEFDPFRYVGVCGPSVSPPCPPIPYFGLCRSVAGDLNECNYQCTGAGVDFFSTPGGCGWHDTFYLGVPLAYTWVTGKNRRSLGDLDVLYEKNRWFNPRFGALVAEEGGEFETEELFYTNSRDFEFEVSDTGGRSDDFRNARFMAMASCTARGHKDGLQPLTMWSDLLKATGEFGYSRPQLINVHLDLLGTSDTTADENIIWH